MKLIKNTLTAALAGLALSLSMSAVAYDDALADRMNNVTGKMDRAFFTTWTHIDGKDVLRMQAEGVKFTLVDIRTPEEKAVMALTLPNALSIPLNELFQRTSLDRLEKLPADQKILLVCKGGTRSTLASSYLALLGFRNVTFVHGGSDAIVAALSPRSVK